MLIKKMIAVLIKLKTVKAITIIKFFDSLNNLRNINYYE